MKIADVESVLIRSGFRRTSLLLTLPIVVHGVPGCGKSTVIRQLIESPSVQARTLGAGYGQNLTQSGVLPHNSQLLPPVGQLTLLDEYQLGNSALAVGFTFLFGDPFQGPFHLPAHFIKEFSHRVPRPVTDFLLSRGFQIAGDRPGVITTRPPFGSAVSNPTQGIVLHLGPISKQLTHSHGICSKFPFEVSGLEFPEVTLVYHSSELADREAFYVAATRTLNSLVLISDEFHELRSSS